MDTHFSANGDNSFLANSDNLMALLDQMGMADPRLQMIMEFMRNQPPPQAERVAIAERPAKIKPVLARYQQLKHENLILLERNDILASALGACPDCWGEDEECEMCNGHGVPGAYAPDKDAFVEYVLPVVRQLRSLVRRERSVYVDAAIETKTHSNGRQTTIHQPQEI